MAEKRVIVFGGRGGLGSVLVDHFINANWWVLSIDLAANDKASVSIAVDKDYDWQTQHAAVTTAVASHLGDNKLDAIVNVAGGWAGGNASSADFIKNSELMWKQSVWSSTISASLGSKHLKEGGLLVLPGAQPAVAGTPGMIGYGMAKAAVHQLTKSLAGSGSGLPKDVVALALLPITLDTPMNRKYMPDADFSTWTSLEFIGELMLKWATDRDRPKSGSLVKLVTKGGVTNLVCE